MVFDGIVPVFTHTPPTTDRASITTTRFFIFEAATAARCPLGPEPMIARSYFTALMRLVLPHPAFTPALLPGLAETLQPEANILLQLLMVKPMKSPGRFPGLYGMFTGDQFGKGLFF